MSDFPKGGDVAATRAWLDKRRFNGLLVDWDAEMLLGAEKSDIIEEIGAANSRKLWGLLKIARETPTKTRVLAAQKENRNWIQSDHFNRGKAASDYSAASNDIARFNGAGLMSHAVYYDPTDTEEDDRPTKLYALLKQPVRCGEKLLNALACILTVYNDMSKVSESGPITSSTLERDDTVQGKFLQGLELIFGKQLTVTKKIGNSNLAKFNCGDGPASETSTPDGYLFDSCHCVRGIIEVTHSTDSPHVPLRQGIAEAFNVAITQLKSNVEWNKVMVFVIGSNGFLLQLGVVFVLYPSFPVFIPLTACLDMTEENMRRQACHAMCCFKVWIDTPLDGYTANQSHASPVLSCAALSTTLYHMKMLKDFYRAKAGLQTSLHHYFRVMSRLHQSENCRTFVVFPICVREYDEDDEKSCIIFPKLHGYSIGFPESEELRQLYFETLRAAIDCIHEAGVVHLDLYPSNIMWKCNEQGGIALKIIDWDSSHFIHEELEGRVSQILEGRVHILSEFSLPGDKLNLTSYDWAYYRLMEDNFNNLNFRSCDKSALDAEFRRLCSESS